MRVLVTGGAGYIGSHTAKALACAGMEPVVLDDLSAGHRWAVRWGPFIQGDLANSELLARVLRDFKIEAAIHFAGFACVGESMSQPGKYFRNNTVNTLNLLEALQRANVTRIVFSSTCATYGIPNQVPIPEDHTQNPVNPYGESKLSVERMLRWFGEAHGLGWVALRYFNAAGADPDTEIGELHHPETHLIPLAVQAAVGSGAELNIFGSDYPTPDGTAIRDYIHVTDLAAAHVAALRYLAADGPSVACNLGTGEGRSIREVIAMVERLSGRRTPRRDAPRRIGDPPVLVADARRAREILNWTPRFSGLETIIGTAIEWQNRLATLSDPGGATVIGCSSHNQLESPAPAAVPGASFST